MNLQWSTKQFNELTAEELYAILRLRSEVFVVEQNCVFLDMDNKDQDCWHVSCRIDGMLVGATRLVPKDIFYKEPSIGRVVTSPAIRRTGVGRPLMEKSISEVYRLFGKEPIRIGAQLYLTKFYSSFGFRQTGEVYLEDGIEHIEMLLP